MTQIVKKLMDYIDNNNIDEANNLIKHIFKLLKGKKDNCKYNDEHIKDIFLPWLKENIYIREDLKEIISVYVTNKNIFDEEQVIKISKYNEIWIVLCEEALTDMAFCENRKLIEKLFDNILDKGFIPNKQQFIDIINNLNREYLKILSTKNIINDLKIKYKNEIFNNLIQNYDSVVYDLFFSDYKYNEKEINHIFTGKQEIILNVLSKMQFKENIKLDEKHFEIIMYYNIFAPVAKLIKNNYFINHDKCFRLFWKKIEVIIMSEYPCYGISIYVPKSEIANLFEIYKIFNCGEYGNYILDEHFKVFFKKGWTDFINYLIKEKNIYPSNDCFESYITNVTNDKTFNDYFPEINFTEDNLYLACLYKRINVIKLILEQKIKPTERCFKAILEKNNNTTILQLELNNIKIIIDHFIHYSYFLSNDDILFLTKKKIIINDSYFTKNLKFNDEEKEELYSYCDLDFMPKYNDTLFNDILWLRRMCKSAKRADDYKVIKQFIKKTKIEMDFVCYVYLINNYNHNKMKDELLQMYNDNEYDNNK